MYPIFYVYDVRKKHTVYECVYVDCGAELCSQEMVMSSN